MLTKLHNLFAGWYADTKTWCMRVLAACVSYPLLAWQWTVKMAAKLNPMHRAWIVALRFEPWPDDDEKRGKERLFAYPWGLTVALSFGRYVWTGKPWAHDWSNPDANVFRCLVPLPGLFISFKGSNGAGFYIGSKPYNIDSDSGRCQWAEFPDEEGAVYLHPSATLRRTADK